MDGEETTLPSSTPRPGENPPPFADRYAIKGELGRGGLGRVLLAHDPIIDRDVAIKELLDAARSGSKLGKRFLREAKLTGQLEHPGIVPIYELAQRPSGEPYYAMKVIRGETLAARIATRTKLETRLELLAQLLPVCQTIAFAHENGVIHRDLKPANVMLGSFGETVVLDWGLAKRIGTEELESDSSGPQIAADENLTARGRPIGTPAYMSPEQARGLVEAIDQRSDVWSLGVMLFEILTGRLPFRSRGTPLLLEVAEGKAPRVRDVEPRIPRALAAICDRCMAREPKDRYPDARQLAHDLERYIAGGIVEAYSYTWLERTARWLSRHHKKLWIALAAVAATFLGVVQYQASAKLGEGDGELAPEVRDALSIAKERERVEALVELPTNPENAAEPMIEAIHGCTTNHRTPDCLYDRVGKVALAALDWAKLDDPETRAILEPLSHTADIDTFRRAATRGRYQTWGAVAFPRPGQHVFTMDIFVFNDLQRLAMLAAVRAETLAREGRIEEARAMLRDLFVASHSLEQDIAIAAVVGMRNKHHLADHLARLSERAGDSAAATRWKAYARYEEERRKRVVDSIRNIDDLSFDVLLALADDRDIIIGLRAEAHTFAVMIAYSSNLWRMMWGPGDAVRDRLFVPGTEPILEMTKLVVAQEIDRGFWARAKIVLELGGD